MENTHSEHLPEQTMLKDRYRILRVVGENRNGTTYQGIDTQTNTVVLIHEFGAAGVSAREMSGDLLIPASKKAFFDSMRLKFMKEASTLMGLAGEERRGVVPVTDVFEGFQTAFAVMELPDSVTLGEKLRSQSVVMTIQETCAILDPAVNALIRLQNVGVIHGGIQPDTILINRSGESMLLFFGDASYLRNPNADSTPDSENAFLAPEQKKEYAAPGPWSDVYSLAAVIYYCTSGMTVSSAMRAGEGMSQARSLSQIGVSVSSEVDQVIASALEMNYAGRYQNVAQFWYTLGAAFSGRLTKQETPKKEKSSGKKGLGKGSAKAADKSWKVQEEGQSSSVNKKRLMILLPAAAVALALIVGSTLMKKPDDTEKSGGGAENTVSNAVDGAESTSLDGTGSSYEGEIFFDDGVYYLYPYSDISLAFSAMGTENNSKFTLVQDGQGDINLETLYLRYVPDRDVYIIEMPYLEQVEGSTLVLSVKDQAAEPGAALCMRPYADTEDQYWTVEYDTEQDVAYISSVYGTYLDISGYDNDGGSGGIRLYDFTGDIKQQWFLLGPLEEE